MVLLKSFILFYVIAIVQCNSDDAKRSQEICTERRKSPYCCGSPVEYTAEGMEEKVPGYPWIVSIIYKGKTVCGGTLITAEHILTAKECIFNGDNKTIDPKDVTIQFPAIQSGTKDGIQAARFIGNNDKVAIIVLNRPIKFDNERRPICIPSSKSIVETMTSPEYIHLASDDCESSGGSALYTVDVEKHRYVLGAILKKDAGCARSLGEDHIALNEETLKWIREETKSSCYCDDD